MKTLSLATALTVVVLSGAQASELAVASTAHLSAQAKKQQLAKKFQVRDVGEIRRAFSLVGRGGRQTQALEISCWPASSSACSDEFSAACDRKKGTLSSGGDNTVGRPEVEHKPAPGTLEGCRTSRSRKAGGAWFRGVVLLPFVLVFYFSVLCLFFCCCLFFVCF